MFLKRLIAVIGFVIYLFNVHSSFALIRAEDIDTPQKIADLKPIQIIESSPYMNFLELHNNEKKPEDAILIDISKFISLKESMPRVEQNFYGRQGFSLITADDSSLEFSFNVKVDGLYSINMDYYPILGKASAIERAILIDGKSQYDESNNVALFRLWQNGSEIIRDSRNNDIRPDQVEKPMWVNSYLYDPSGISNEPLLFYLTSGEHKLNIVSVREPLAIGSITFKNIPKIDSYENIKNTYSNINSSDNDNYISFLQAENANLKSSSTLFPNYDRSSSATQPSDPVKIRYNIISGMQYKSSGQWIEWNLDIKKSGYYKIAVKGKQSFYSGSVATRSLYIDGKIPFAEVEKIKFTYSTEWQMFVLGNGEEPFLFKLDEGIHKIRLEVTLGDISYFVSRVTKAIFDLNATYRKILIFTGPSPDVNRDYKFTEVIPDVISDLEKNNEVIKQLYNDYISLTGQNGEKAQVFKKLYIQLDQILKDPDMNLAGQFIQFKNNIASLGTWNNEAKSQPLDIDYIVVASPKTNFPKPVASFWGDMEFNIKSFLASFFEDYSAIGDVSGEAVSVWLGSGLTGGRDQANIVKQMVVNDFTPKFKKEINLELVSMGALLPATMSGKGPDVALSIGTTDVMNYAFRGAVYDLSKFKDFDEVKNQYFKSALEPVTFNNGVYGLPETQTWPMMFYRKDILSNLNLSVPQTWDDVINMLPVLQKKQLNFGLPIAASDLQVGIGIGPFCMFLFQNGGALYLNDGRESGLTQPQAVDAFYQWTNFYLDYAQPKSYDVANRFRTGEIPILVADYSFYNQLTVFAPEIMGMWGFSLVPGIKQKDGTINRSVAGAVTSSILLSKAKNKEASWEFLKWWTAKDAQIKFGYSLESIMGPAGRYTPANKDALYQIPWRKADFDILMNQWQFTKGINEVPGSYLTSRFLDFSFKSVVNNGADPADEILNTKQIVDNEIRSKRKELSLN